MDTTSLTSEALELRLLELESGIARRRGEQMVVLRELDRRQTPMRDGHRSLKEWATGRIMPALEEPWGS